MKFSKFMDFILMYLFEVFWLQDISATLYFEDDGVRPDLRRVRRPNMLVSLEAEYKPNYL